MPIGVYPRTEAHRAKLKARRATPETRAKISDALKGKNNAQFGKTGEANSNWKGGTYRSLGYVMQYCPNHPHANRWGYALQHRLIMEQYLGRYLDPKEIVHHKNGDITDNRIENLQLFSNQAEHTRYHRKLQVAQSAAQRKGGLSHAPPCSFY